MPGPKKTAPADSIEESYSLSPLQHGLVFDGLSARHSGGDIVQVIGTLPEEVNGTAFREAWEAIVERHAILRTGFGGEGLHARQEVHRHVRLHFEQKEWPGLREREQQSRLESYLQADRRRGFESSVPPLMRLALFNVGPANHIFALTYHQLLLDSCTLTTLLTEFFNSYEARCQRRKLELPPPRPYRQYIEWLRKRDWSAAEMFWRTQLEGFVTPTPLGVSRRPGNAPADNPRWALQQMILPSTESERLRSVARQIGLSVQTILDGAWGVL